MDYCIPCSRTLNGAVTCPECGAYDSRMAPLGEPGDVAPATVGTRTAEFHFSELPGPIASPDGAEGPGAPTPPQELPTGRDNRPPRMRRYAVRSLAAAAFTVLGGVATASVLPQSATPRAATIPDQPLPEDSRLDVTDSPTSSTPPERATTHPARKAVENRGGEGFRRPLPTVTPSAPPTSRSPSAATSSAPPPARTRPAPRPTGSRPASPTRTASASARPSASPTGSASASPSGSRSPGIGLGIGD